jgi:hypothetical protein
MGHSGVEVVDVDLEVEHLVLTRGRLRHVGGR